MVAVDVHHNSVLLIADGKARMLVATHYSSETAVSAQALLALERSAEGCSSSREQEVGLHPILQHHEVPKRFPGSLFPLDTVICTLVPSRCCLLDVH